MRLFFHHACKSGRRFSLMALYFYSTWFNAASNRYDKLDFSETIDCKQLTYISVFCRSNVFLLTRYNKNEPLSNCYLQTLCTIFHIKFLLKRFRFTLITSFKCSLYQISLREIIGLFQNSPVNYIELDVILASGISRYFASKQREI